MCRADSGGRGSRARSRRPAFAVRASRGAHAHHLSRRSRQNPSFTNSVRTVSALIGCPICVRVAASFSMLFDTQINGRIGSPSVAGSTKRLSAGTSPGSFSQTDRRPPPARRTCPFGSGCASRSCLPRLIVERASPVILETITRPPRPELRNVIARADRRAAHQVGGDRVSDALMLRAKPQLLPSLDRACSIHSLIFLMAAGLLTGFGLVGL